MAVWRDFFLTVVAMLLTITITSCIAETTGEAVQDIKVTDPSADTDVFDKFGDITLISNSSKMREKRNAVFPNSGQVWPNGIVPYEIAPVFNAGERRLILQAMKHWEECTCIRFRPRTGSDIYAVMFITGNQGVCQSFVGRISARAQPQGITLGPGCLFFSTIVHEIGHAVGFYHEHTRSDRDDYVQVLLQNIKPGFERAFQKLNQGDASTLGYGYDYASVMHYRDSTFAQPNTISLTSRQPGIPLGGSELSPLDAAKANALYRCGPHNTHPPPNVIVPAVLATTLPPGISCGSVIDVTRDGSFRSPGFPSRRTNQRCAFVLKAPEGYGFEFSFPGFQVLQNSGCTRDFVQVFFGASRSTSDLVIYNNLPGGRMCDNAFRNFRFSLSASTITFYYQTDGSSGGSARGLEVSYKIIDVNECQQSRTSGCHTCTNLDGSFECGCRKGYYHSFAASTCFDVNECAFGNGGCSHTCTNLGGGYRCSCRSGFFLQLDGLSCGTTRPAGTPRALTPGTVIPKVQTPAPNTPATTTPRVPTPRATPPATATPATTLSPQCGGGPRVLSAASGSIQTLNWPNSPYPTNTNCEWEIKCPSGSKIEINFESSFRVAGQAPGCTKDRVNIFDCGRTVEHSPYCHLTAPQPITSSCNAVIVEWRAGSQRGLTRTGFKMNYRCVGGAPPTPTLPPPTRPTTPSPTTPRPTTPSPTTPKPTTPSPTTPKPTTPSPTTPTPTQSPQCGGGPPVMTASTGSIQTLGYDKQQPYPIDTNCLWRIECPANQRIRITFSSSFRVAGRMPDCLKDTLQIFDCNAGVIYGPFCHLTAPAPITTQCNAADVFFKAGSGRGVTRTGFGLNYECV